MKHSIAPIALLLAAALIAGCGEDRIVDEPSAPVATELSIDELLSESEMALLTKTEISELERVAKGASGYTVDRVDVSTFLPAGDVGGGVLTPGTVFPPIRFGKSILFRGADRLRMLIVTSGLPAGTYTVWWVIFNSPDECTVPNPFNGVCGGSFDDLLNPATGAAVHWATGGVVRHNGIGVFTATTKIGDDLGTPGEQYIQGPGLVDPTGAEVHLVIKYHGPPSSDPDVLFDQTHTFLGSCEAGANAIDFGPPFGVQCFDPQVAIHP